MKIWKDFISSTRRRQCRKASPLSSSAHATKYLINILCKTTGFRGVIKSLPSIIRKGIEYKSLTKDFFNSYFLKVKDYLHKEGKSLTSQDFGSGEAAQNALADYILKPLSSFTYIGNQVSTNKN